VRAGVHVERDLRLSTRSRERVCAVLTCPFPDAGAIDNDGFAYLTDRLKELIKYKGFQVAPAELENVVVSHPHVADVVVIPRPDDRVRHSVGLRTDLV